MCPHFEMICLLSHCCSLWLITLYTFIGSIFLKHNWVWDCEMLVGCFSCQNSKIMCWLVVPIFFHGLRWERKQWSVNKSVLGQFNRKIIKQNRHFSLWAIIQRERHSIRQENGEKERENQIERLRENERHCRNQYFRSVHSKWIRCQGNLFLGPF